MKTPRITHRKLLSSSFTLLTARLFGIGVTFATLSVLSARLTADEFGAWNILLSAFQLALLSELGLGVALRNRVSTLLAHGRFNQAMYRITALMALFLALLVPLAALAGASGLLPGWLGLPDTPGYRWMVALVVEVGVLFLVFSTAVNCFFCHAEGNAVAAVEWGRGLGQLAAIGLGAWLGLSLFGFVAAFYGALVFVSMAGAAGYFVRRGFNPLAVLARGRRSLRVVGRTARELIGEALLQGLVHAGSIVNLSIGAIVVARELSLADAGLYSVMMRLFGAALTLHLAVISPYWSAFTIKFATGERGWMARSIRVLALITAAAWAAGLAAVLFVGPWITEVLVHQRVDDRALWALFSAWALLMAMANLHNMVLQSVGRLKRLAVVVGAGAVGHFFLAGWLARLYGVHGVIAATLVVTAVILAYSGAESWALMRGAQRGRAVVPQA